MHDWFFFQFREHNSHRRYLFKTYPNALVYCSPTSTFWGVGLSKGEKEVQDPSKWKGKNKLGELLTKIRDEMMQDQNLVFDVPGSGSGNGNTTTTTTTAAEAPRGRKRPLSPRQLVENTGTSTASTSTASTSTASGNSTSGSSGGSSSGGSSQETQRPRLTRQNAVVGRAAFDTAADQNP